MDAKVFQQIFDQFDCPVLLKADQGWLTNPAARSLCLSQADLERLEEWGGDASLWLARQFYRVSASRLDGALLLMFQPDTFLASAAGNISSQLRDRLNSALGSVAALSENEALSADPRARDNLSIVSRNLYRIFRMTTQLERCTPSSAFMGETEQVDMVKWFDKLAGEIETLCRESEVAFSYESDVTALSMPVNQRQLSYMVLSLISNALKTVPEQGGRVTLSMKRQQGQVVFTVIDNAGGLPPDYLRNPLWNFPQRLLPRRGLGLGLPLVQRIVADHDGTLMVYPSQQGTRVVVSLPIRKKGPVLTQGKPKPTIEDTPNFSLAKILLSDALPDRVYFPNPYEDDE